MNEDGTFSDTLKVDKGYFTLVHNRENSAFYITPGDELHLTLNTAEFDETIAYSGVGSENNNYLAEKYMTDEKVSGTVADVYALEESDFLNKSDSSSGDSRFEETIESATNKMKKLIDTIG